MISQASQSQSLEDLCLTSRLSTYCGDFAFLPQHAMLEAQLHTHTNLALSRDRSKVQAGSTNAFGSTLISRQLYGTGSYVQKQQHASDVSAKSNTEFNPIRMTPPLHGTSRMFRLPERPVCSCVQYLSCLALMKVQHCSCKACGTFGPV
jgi:hypothetical protein